MIEQLWKIEFMREKLTDEMDYSVETINGMETTELEEACLLSGIDLPHED